MFKGKAIIGCNSRKLNSCGKSAADAPPIHPFVHKGQVRSQAEQVQPLLKFLSRDLQDVATDVRPQLRIHLQLKFWFPASFGLLGHPSGRGCCCFSSSSIHHKVSNISRTQSIENHEKMTFLISIIMYTKVDTKALSLQIMIIFPTRPSESIQKKRK